MLKLVTSRLSRSLAALLIVGGTALAWGYAQTRKTSFFPPYSFHDLYYLHVDIDQMWSVLLATFNEAPITGPTPDFVLRVTRAPSYSDTIVLRVSLKTYGGVSATLKKIAPHTTSPIRKSTILVSVANVRKIQKLLGMEKFWELTDHDDRHVLVSDGTMILIEANDHGRYHAVTSLNGTNEPALHIAKTIFSLAGAAIQPN